MAQVLSVVTNIDEVVGDIIGRIKEATDPEYLLRPIAFDVIELMTKRIHIDGVASDGGPIGTYSEDYLSYRIKHFKRTTDTKVIVSLTRQLENDWSVIATDKGYGVGFKNSFNLDKARWVEKIKDKIIFNLTQSESKYVIDFAMELISKKFSE